MANERTVVPGKALSTGTSQAYQYMVLGNADDAGDDLSADPADRVDGDGAGGFCSMYLGIPAGRQLLSHSIHA